MKPITPNEVANLKENLCPPDPVIEAFNICIAENWDGRTSTVKQNEVVEKILELSKKDDAKLTKDKIFEKRYLDIEIIYQKHGWNVDYDKPGYNESFEPYWVFSKKFNR